MNAKEVSDIVRAEIGNHWTQSNAHGVDLKACLVEPEKKRYIDFMKDSSENTFLELWLVLEEDPKEKNGYKIVFDENIRYFGLAITQMNGPDVFIGYYGTFMETLEAM